MHHNQGIRIANAFYNNPKTPRYFLEFAEELIKNGYKGIFIDEPTKQECWCEYCRNKYFTMFGKELDHNKETEEISIFKRNNAMEYIQTICDGVKRKHPDIKTIVCVMPFDKEYWSEIVKIETLDDFGTDPYWLVTDIGFERAIQDTVDVKRICVENKKAISYLVKWMENQSRR